MDIIQFILVLVSLNNLFVHTTPVVEVVVVVVCLLYLGYVWGHSIM